MIYIELYLKALYGRFRVVIVDYNKKAPTIVEVFILIQHIFLYH